MQIYFAGPLFSLAEREFNQRLSSLVCQGLEGASAILPQDETQRLMAESDPCARIFDFCVGSIDRADVVVAILDGPDVDSGTSFEIGYAFSRKKPIIGVRTDPRQLEDQGVNLMISRSVNSMIWLDSSHLSLEELADKVIRVLRSANLATVPSSGPVQG
ncbi:MAG: nucleoside 2-deoxyribosyltransferase [Methanomassiliicoccus sp.]|nr:nucleoside 2-deoxyribosyltransferase [Methanomassiliicoccus sp.]